MEKWEKKINSLSQCTRVLSLAEPTAQYSLPLLRAVRELSRFRWFGRKQAGSFQASDKVRRRMNQLLSRSMYICICHHPIVIYRMMD